MSSNRIPEHLNLLIEGYEILDHLGDGAMATVYRAHSADGREVALKILGSDLAGDVDALKRIRREIKILERLKHPNIIQLLDHGQDESGRPWLAFELVKGPTMSDLIDTHEEIAPEVGLKWMIQAASALDEAWKHHIIHRDIKPGNMMIHPERGLVLGDFGLAKALYEDTDISVHGAMLGTPRYISPEMGMGLSLDARADIYSLGATFYHLFLEQSPFDGRNLMSLVTQHAHAPLPPPHTINPELHPDIGDILVHCMQKDPKKRYQNYAELINDLSEALLAVRAARLDHEATPEYSFSIEPTADVAGSGHRTMIGLIVVGALMLGAIALLIIQTERTLNPVAEQDSVVSNVLDRFSLQPPVEVLRPTHFQSGAWREANGAWMARLLADPAAFAPGAPPARDIWGAEMSYSAERGVLASAGADGIFETADDMVLTREALESRE